MFRVECFCDDKQLPRLLWALSEFGAYNVTSQPVADNTGARTNGEDKPKKHQREQLTKAQLVELFVKHARKHKLREAAADTIKDFAAASGYAPGSRQYITKLLRDFGALTKIPGSDKDHIRFTRYRVTLSKIKKQPRKEA